MKTRKIEVQGVKISVTENNYISLNEIIKESSDEPTQTVRNWIKNVNTVRFLWAWEEVNNSNFKGKSLKDYIFQITSNRYNLSPSKWTKETGAIGIYTKMGRGGGTFAHEEIALEFCSWYDPYFKVYLMTEFQRLKREESLTLDENRRWHISKLTDYVDNARNLLDTIPDQDPVRNRIAAKTKKNDS